MTGEAKRGTALLDEHAASMSVLAERPLKAKRTDSIRAARAARLRPLTIEDLQGTAPPTWLVREVVQGRSFALLYGDSGSGKTFLAIDLAGAVARGEPFQGRRVHQGGVVYIAGEGHLQARLRAYLHHYKITAEHLAGMRALCATVDLFNPEADLLPLLEALDEAAQDMGGVALVVLDTLNAMMGAGDENSSEAMGAMIRSARRIMDSLGCTVVYVHHGGKTEGRGARGHSSLRAAVDTEIAVSLNATTGERSWKVTKQRDGEAGHDFAFRLLPVDLGPSPDPEADSDERLVSCVVEQQDPPVRSLDTPKPHKLDVALDALRESLFEHGELLPPTSTIPPGTRGVQLDRWAARFRLRTGDDYASERIASAAFRRERQKLISSGQVVVSHPYAWVNG